MIRASGLEVAPRGHSRTFTKAFLRKIFEKPSALKTLFSCGLGGGEKLFGPQASGHKGLDVSGKTRPKKFKFMLFFSSLTETLQN